MLKRKGGQRLLYNPLINSRVRRKGRMVTIPFARGKHMQFAVVLVIYDIIYIKHCSCSGLFNSLL